MEIIRQKVINIEDNENNKKLNLEKNEENDENEEKKSGNGEQENEGENVYHVGDEGKSEKEKNEEDNEEKDEGEEEKEKLDEMENSAENKKNSKKKIVKKRNDIDEEYNELKKKKDTLDEIADEISSKPEKQSLNETEKNEINEEKEEENDENSQEKKINEKIREVEEINLKVNEYYGGSYYGLPSTYIYYSIAHQLHKENTYYLWYLIISLTDEYLRYHISDKKYDKIYAICQSEILRIEKKKPKEDDTLKIYKSTSKEGKTILIGSDYKLILYRHWNLYDSFIYSTYPLGILSTWKEPGKGEVQKIFAYMGIPLSEAKQKYRYMKNEYLDTFRDKIIDVSKKFFLNDIIFHSFIYQFDNNTEMSASDCVYLLSCLIECPFEEFNNIEIEDDDFIDDNISNISEDGDDKNEKIGDQMNNGGDEQNEEKLKINNDKNKENTLKRFWMAYRFLSLKKLNMTNSLVDIAIKFQIALTNNATSILDKNGVKNEQKFRYSIVSGNLSDDSRYFHYPGNLERLSLVICETYKQMKGKKFENKPYLLAYIDAENKTYVIDGNLGCNKKDDEEKNTFPIQFKFVAKKLKIPVSYNYSTEEIITIKKDDLYSFINQIAQL
jgi:cell division control protein 45